LPRRSPELDAQLHDLQRFIDQSETLSEPAVAPIAWQPRFAYSQKERVLIEEEIRELRHFEEFKCRVLSGLEDQGNIFRNRPSRPPSLSEISQRWVRAAQKLGELQKSIMDASKAYFCDPVCNAYSQSEIEEIDRHLSSLHDLHLVIAKKATGMRPAQENWKDGREYSDWARSSYFAHVFAWWEALGGKLTWPSDGSTGPFPRYFFAVVGPVMKNRQPSRQSLRNVVLAYLDARKKGRFAGLRRLPSPFGGHPPDQETTPDA
jgi:hypothetical protein